MPTATAQVENSIMHDMKQLLGQEWDDTTFDTDIRIHINSVFADLDQLGVGPSGGFTISDYTTLWSAYVTTKNMEAVKSYMYMRLRMIFDPPATGPLMQSMQAQIDKAEWRLMVENDPPLGASDDPPDDAEPISTGEIDGMFP